MSVGVKGRRKATPEITVGGGKRHGVLVVVLFLAGMAVGGVAVNNFMNAGGYYLPTAASLLLMLAATFLATLKSADEKKGQN